MKKIICLLLSVVLIMTLFATVVSADEETGETTTPTEAVRDPGQCGEDLYWKFSDGTLTVTGSGAMDDFPGNAPWDAHKDEIRSVVLDGVTYIGANAFRDYDALKTVDFGDALYEIGPDAFRSCDGLTAISLPSSFKVFGESSFMSCKNLKEIRSAGRFPSFRQNSMWDTYVTIYFPAERPWSASTIQELETAFQGRIEFLASDGSDPVPNEPEETEPTETEPEETEPVTTEPETTETTVPPTDPVVTPAETLPEIQTEEREEPEEKPAEKAPEEDAPAPGSWIGLVLIAAVLVAVLLGILLCRPKGKYSRRR